MKASIRKTLAKVLYVFSNMLITEYVTATASATVNGGDTKGFTFSTSKVGYVPVGAVAFDCQYGEIYPVSIIRNAGGTTYSMWVHNPTNTARTIQPKMTILYCKSLVGGYCVTQLLQCLQPFPRVEVA